MAELIIKNVNKVYPNNVQAVFDFNLHINDGEFIVLVGPSGCGKSTMLRMIVGLEKITSGEMVIRDYVEKDGKKVLEETVINNLSPGERDIAMVFQNYALYPHMTVYNNIGISLKLKHEDKFFIHDKVMATSNNIGLMEYLNRLPRQLSGGQRQRVALGRTIVRNPKIFLMDEPLSNLDAKLRVKTRTEIVLLQKKLGVTVVYVTHDQIEAMTMADRIVVMNNGYVQQVGTPYEVYHKPNNMFVAGFIGSLPMNMLRVCVEGDYVSQGDRRWQLASKDIQILKPYVGKEVMMGVRPENISIHPEDLKQYQASTNEYHIDFIDMLGCDLHVRMYNPETPNVNIVMQTSSEYDLQKNTSISVAFKMDKVHFFDVDSEERIS